ncbi:unnamed protein product [Adineta steineri]|uniref:Polyketide synthase n=1 Tax=Adineta steineri TaxID=433720 RepID=A0A819A0X4_9BILA|nr:unnamed protein product [Adineta steineri]CAF1123215.1 unnamed protein product [Adineta steineri]CAF1291983.1 unnamed protein product [Adineta steineri]CAF3770914.1 unnamed protein product [Adineta steineri]CAF3845816.1 unnamed protein product [Adineta steineri]
MSNSNNGLEPVAVVGIACEFAGDIHSANDLWHALEDSQDVGSAIPRDRLDLESYCAHMFNKDNDGQFRQKLIRRGYFLSNNQWDMFEPSFFGLSDAEAGSIDPCHRLLMLKFVHLLDDAGYSIEKMHGSKTSVHIGQFSTDHAITSFRMAPEHRSRFHGPNSLLYNAAARLSYHFNLQGPNVSLDVACSSSLETVHLAVQSLRTNEVDMAVCGGVNAVCSPENLLYGSIMGAISPDGRSRSFSVDANGYAKGDGLGLLLLKRLSDAERDNDRIYCVLRDVLSNHDGSEDKNSFVVPSTAGQARLLNDIYKRADFDPRRIFYVEAHGTGTPIGDPIEANCLGQFFNRSCFDPPLLIGSVKSNLGHTEGTAGIAGLIKIAMCMHHRSIPPNMHFTSLNPNIEAQRYNLHVVQHSVPFPVGNATDSIAMGINSFGIGGNNAHAIVEEYHPSKTSAMNRSENDMESKQYFIFIFSTKSRKSLNNQVAQFNRWLQNTSIIDMNNNYAFLQRISRQLLLKRTISHAHLAIFVFADSQQLQEQFNAFLFEETLPGLSIFVRPTISLAKICFVFSGQGPQWWAMGRQLYESEPVFTRWIQLIDAEMTKINNGEWNLLEELISKKSEDESRINDTNIAQPALFTIQVGLAALLVSWNIYPSTIVSHSAGDQAAAFVAGRLTLQEAVCIVYHRSRLQNRNTRQGGRMLAVSMSEEEVQNKLLKGIEHLVCIAVVNSPRSVTLSGDEKIIDELQQTLSTFYPNVFKARLRIENAFHSYQMDRFDIEKEMLSSLKDIQGLPLKDSQQMFNLKCAKANLYSSVTGSKLSDQVPVNAHYWWSNVRQCVRFHDAMVSIQQHDAPTVFLELSPHPVLATSIGECYESTNSQPLILPTLKRKENEQITLLTSLAQLTTSSHVWHQYFQTRNITSMIDNEQLFDDFPLYTFDLSSCWYESKESVMTRLANRIPIHPLLGVRQLTGQTSAMWKSLININLPQYAYLKDHKIQDAIIFPAVAYLELVTAAYHQLFLSSDSKQSSLVLKQIKFVKALSLNEHELTEVFTQIVIPVRQWFVYSRPWTSAGSDCMHSSGMASVDVVDSFIDPETLNQYSLREFTLHAHGHIEMDGVQQKLTTLISTSPTYTTWLTADANSIYTHLSIRGYQYGPSVRNIKSLCGTTSTIVAHIQSNLDAITDLSSYHLLHPSLLGTFVQPPLVLLPGTDTTFVPVSIHKFIATSTINTSRSNFELRGKYHDAVCGLSQERTYTGDFLVLPSDDTTINEPMFIFEGLTYQQVQGVQSGRWTLEKSIFDKLNADVDLPNVDRSEQLDTIIKDYCMERIWMDSPIIKSVVDLLPSLDQIRNGGIDVVSNQDLIDSIAPFNELAACYAQIAIKDLDLNLVGNQYRPLLNACNSLVTVLHEPITVHSTQLRLRQLFNHFPRLKSLLTLLDTYGSCLKDVFTGQQNGLDIFLGNNETERTLQDIKTIMSAHKTEQIFHAICQHLHILNDQSSHGSLSDRRLRIFWYASGEQMDVLPVLHFLLNLSHETSLCIDLHYADMDTVQLAQAEQLFETHLANQTHLNIIYDQTINLFNNEILEKIPFESFDIVFAANKLQESEDLMRSLINLRHLLVPNGLLLLLELTDVPLYFDLIFGLLDHWWLPSSNARALHNIHQWTTALREIGGFDDVQTVMSQYESTLIIARKTISQKALQTLDERKHQAWLFFGRNDPQSIGHRIIPLLPCSNIRFLDISASTIDKIQFALKTMMKKYKQLYIVFAWRFEQTYLGDNSDSAFKEHEESICGTFIQLLQTIHAISPTFLPFIFVITRHAQLNTGSDCNLLQSPFIGLVRSLMVEYEQHRLKLIDLQAPPTMINESAPLHALVKYMVTSRYTKNTDEIVLRFDTNEKKVKQITWHYKMLQTPDKKEDQSKPKQICIIPRQDANQQPFHLRVPPSRFLTELTWVPDNRTKELLSGMVEVQIHCVGINFRDVLKAQGLYPHTRTFAQLDEHQPYMNWDTEPGSDFVGTIVRTCPSVSFQLGDRVVGLVHGAFHSHVIVNALQVKCIPPECPLTDEQLSAMPVVCLTVIYSLKYRVHLRRGQTVLIHAATGGAGQICIQYCQWVGARVLATAGTEEKRRFLREHCGVEYVFNSRDASFVSGVRSILPHGVDVVINSLSGSLLQESIKLLADHGHFVEWGKRDVFDKSPLSMFDFRSDCSFHVIDLVSLSNKHPNICTAMLQEMIDLLMQGKFKAIEPTVVYEPSQVIDAFMRSNSGQAMGKAVVRLINSNESLCLNSVHHNDIMFPSNVCQQGTILISGGFGGLGLTMSRWMIEKRGVKRIILMSRRTLAELEQSSNPQYDDWLRLKQAINEYQAHVDVVQADVTNFDQVYDLIERLSRTSYPVRGVIHSAVVAEDRTLAKMTQEYLTHVLAAKVRGAWILHQVTQLTHAPLYFFLMFSSIRNHLLEVASSGYNAGNQFLDALAHYRMTQQNLPALSVSLPAVSGAGMFHRQRDMLSTLQSTHGFEVLPPIAVFELIERFHANQKTCPCPVIFAVNWQTLYERRHKLPIFQLNKIVEERYIITKLTNISTTSTGLNCSITSNLNRKEAIIERIQMAVARLLGSADFERILVDRSLISQGMDSLAALSLYNWLGQETSVYIPLVDLLQGYSIETIATVIHNKLNERHQVASSSTTKEEHIDADLIKDNEIKLSHNSNYTEQSTNNTDNLNKLFIDKIYKQQSQTRSAVIYAIQIPSVTSTASTSTYARDMILQMRRIQPRGLYQLVAVRNKQEERIAHEMIRQLKDHFMIIDIPLLLLDD